MAASDTASSTIDDDDDGPPAQWGTVATVWTKISNCEKTKTAANATNGDEPYITHRQWWCLVTVSVTTAKSTSATTVFLLFCCRRRLLLLRIGAAFSQ